MENKNDDLNFLSCGMKHSLFIQKGRVLSCGFNKFGRLALGHENDEDEPTEITFFQENKIEITKVQAGFYHSVFLSKEGKCYGSGYCGDGEFGCDPNKLNEKKVVLPVQITGFKEKIADISSRGRHTLFLAESGTVYSCGKNGHGALGLGDTIDRKFPTKILFPTEEKFSNKIVKIETSGACSFFITKEKRAFSCGANENGELGVGDINVRKSPTLIRSIDGINIIKSGHSHNIFLTESNKVFACGSNSFGQLGLGHKKYRILPTSVIIKEKIISVAAGFYCSFVLTEKKELFGFGDNTKNQICSLKNKNICLPMKIKSDFKCDIRGVKSGLEFSFLICKEGIFGVGKNKKGQIGKKGSDNYKKPVKIIFKQIIKEEKPSIEEKKQEIIKPINDKPVEEKKPKNVLKSVKLVEEKSSIIEEEKPEKVKPQERLQRELSKEENEIISLKKKNLKLLRELEMKDIETLGIETKLIKLRTKHRKTKRSLKKQKKTNKSLQEDLERTIKHLETIENKGIIEEKEKKKIMELYYKVTEKEFDLQKISEDEKRKFSSLLMNVKDGYLNNNKKEQSERVKQLEEEKKRLEKELEQMKMQSSEIPKLKLELKLMSKQISEFEAKEDDVDLDLEREEIEKKIEKYQKKKLKIFSHESTKKLYQEKARILERSLQNEKKKMNSILDLLGKMQEKKYLYNAVRTYTKTSVRTGLPVVMKTLKLTNPGQKKVVYSTEIKEHNFLSNLGKESEKFVKLLGSINTDKSSITLVMEKCDCDLTEYLKTQNISILDKLRLLKESAEGFEIMHKYGKIHMDIKGNNIFVCNGKIKIADFDSVQNYKEGFKHKDMLGTPYFCDPYIYDYYLNNDKKLDFNMKARDVYSFGMTTFQVIWEKVPFQDFAREQKILPLDVPKELWKRITSKKVSIFDTLIKNYQEDNNIPLFIHDFIKQCVDVNDINRPNFSEVVTILEDCIEKEIQRQIDIKEKERKEEEEEKKLTEQEKKGLLEKGKLLRAKKKKALEKQNIEGLTFTDQSIQTNIADLRKITIEENFVRIINFFEEKNKEKEDISIEDLSDKLEFAKDMKKKLSKYIDNFRTEIGSYEYGRKNDEIIEMKNEIFELKQKIKTKLKRSKSIETLFLNSKKKKKPKTFEKELRKGNNETRKVKRKMKNENDVISFDRYFV